MKKQIVLLILSTSLGFSLLSGMGTYALLSSSTTNGPNQFNSFSSATIQLSNASNNTRLRSFATMTSNTQQTQLPMFYDYVDYKNGPNPYDYKTNYTPSGEIPGGWAPGDKVKRSWNIQNKGASSKITEITAQLNSLQDQKGNSITTGSQVYQDFLSHMNIKVYSPQGSPTPVYTGTFQQLVSGSQPLDTVICLSKSSTSTVDFVASMDLNAGNDLQGVKGVLDFSLGAEQTQNNCFDPPFSNEDYSMKLGSTTPIKFEDYDSSGNLVTSLPQNVSLVITGPKLGGGTLSLTYSLANYGLSVNGGHYQAQVFGDPNLFVQDSNSTANYTATVYYGNQICCQKSFSTYPGNRSNS